MLSLSNRSGHDYEPDHDTKPHPMAGDPPCLVCGRDKRDRVHRNDDDDEGDV